MSPCQTHASMTVREADPKTIFIGCYWLDVLKNSHLGVWLSTAHTCVNACKILLLASLCWRDASVCAPKKRCHVAEGPILHEKAHLRSVISGYKIFGSVASGPTTGSVSHAGFVGKESVAPPVQDRPSSSHVIEFCWSADLESLSSSVRDLSSFFLSFPQFLLGTKVRYPRKNARSSSRLTRSVSCSIKSHNSKNVGKTNFSSRGSWLTLLGWCTRSHPIYEDSRKTGQR